MWQALSPSGVTIKFRPRLEWGWGSWFGRVSRTAPKPAALCLKPQNFESDPKYTLTAPSHWAEVIQTERRAALPIFWGSLHLEIVQPGPFKVPGVLQDRKGPTELTRVFSSQSKCSILPRQAPSNIHFLKELGD